MSVLAVIGGQLGSEGKGVIVNHLAKEYDTHVRVGGPNAGHSFVHDGITWKMQAVPCGWTNPDALLVLGVGAVVSPEILMREIDEIERAGYSVRDRLLIDGNASVLDETCKLAGGGVEGETHKRYGSTGEGVGPARLGRLSRDPDTFMLARQVESLRPFIYEQTPSLLLSRITRNADILLEGTQGSGLSLVHGPWPYTTNHDTTINQLLADVGIAPRWLTDILMVSRTFPIRVAGNSGPMANEVDWDYMSKRVGKGITEQTTVTKKTRRIGLWDDDLFSRAVILNGPTALALTFADYLVPGDEGKTEWADLSRETHDFCQRLERLSGAPVVLIGTGGDGWNVVDRRKEEENGESSA